LAAKKRQTTFAKLDRERQRMERAMLKRERRQARAQVLAAEGGADTPPSPLPAAGEAPEVSS
jgi:hypothetical protein